MRRSPELSLLCVRCAQDTHMFGITDPDRLESVPVGAHISGAARQVVDWAVWHAEIHQSYVYVSVNNVTYLLISYDPVDGRTMYSTAHLREGMSTDEADACLDISEALLLHNREQGFNISFTNQPHLILGEEAN